MQTVGHADDLPDETSLGTARALVAAQRAEGMHCPCCGQFARNYQRSINAQTARILCRLYAVHGQEWVHITDFLRHEGLKRSDEAKPAYWGLTQNARGRRPDGGQSGWWQITDRGRDWLLRRLTIPKYAVIYNDQVLAHAGPDVSIDDALASGPFRWDTLMGHVLQGN